MSEFEELIGEVAKVPHWRDMDPGQFIQHWRKRHAYHQHFHNLHLKYLDDDDNIWWAVKGHHDRIHAGTFGDDPMFRAPVDHVHLEPLSKVLEELL